MLVGFARRAAEHALTVTYGYRYYYNIVRVIVGLVRSYAYQPTTIPITLTRIETVTITITMLARDNASVLRKELAGRPRRPNDSRVNTSS
jgi:hypothetical protein